MDASVKNRVPHIMFLYWVIKIASTTLGETGADMFSMTFELGYGNTIIIFLALFLILLALKMYLKGYHPVAYWSVFTASAIAGTGLSDYIDRTLGLGYTWGAVILVVLLLATLGWWYWKERSISVERIESPTVEIYYWLAFLIANTLGTAAGDFLADDLELGFMQSALLISIALASIAAAHYLTKKASILLFWLAFVLTRPFGATFGDLLTKPASEGGLNLGTIGASIFFGILLVVAIRIETKQERVISKVLSGMPK